MKERDELIEEARELLGWPDECAGNWPATMADFALKALERESIYREICEAAAMLTMSSGYAMIPNGDAVMVVYRKNDATYSETFDTLAEAFEWVKGGLR